MPATRGTVSGLWIGAELPVSSQMCLSSFAAHGHEVLLYTFDPDIAMPPGVTRADASDILAEDTIFQNPHHPTYTAYANLFRYRLLQRRETTWVDADVLCLGPLPDDPYLFGYEWRKGLNNAVLRAPKDSELLRVLYERAAAFEPSDIGWGMTGPKLITKVVPELGLSRLAQPRRVLYPIHFIQLWRLWDPEQTRWVKRKIAGACTLHLFNEWLRRCSLPIRTMTPPPGSFMAEQLEQAGLRIDGDPVDPQWVRTVWRKELDVRGGPLPRIVWRRAKDEVRKLTSRS